MIKCSFVGRSGNMFIIYSCILVKMVTINLADLFTNDFHSEHKRIALYFAGQCLKEFLNKCFNCARHLGLFLCWLDCLCFLGSGQIIYLLRKERHCMRALQCVFLPFAN